VFLVIETVAIDMIDINSMRRSDDDSVHGFGPTFPRFSPANIKRAAGVPCSRPFDGLPSVRTQTGEVFIIDDGAFSEIEMDVFQNDTS
jgi:hypothetical protein